MFIGIKYAVSLRRSDWLDRLPAIRGSPQSIGSPQFVQAFVAEKSKTPEEDVKKLQLLTDPGVHFKLVRFIDAFGDHVHACKKHTGSRKAAHETILDAIEAICRQAGITTERRNIPTIKKRNGKMGRGDLVLKHVNLGGHRGPLEAWRCLEALRDS